MPYARNADLPEGVRNTLPVEAQTVWRTVFNQAEEKHDDESRAAATAWTAVKNGWEKTEDGWVRKSAAHPLEHILPLFRFARFDDGTVIVKSASLWVGFWLPPEAATQLALAGGEPPEALHLTLAMLGDAADLGEEMVETAREAVSEFAAIMPPLSGRVSGVGRFTGDDRDVVYASLDSPDLPEFRQGLVEALTNAGVPPLKEHGFTPHITLAYVDKDAALEAKPPAADITFDRLQFRIGDVSLDIPLTGKSAGEGVTMQKRDLVETVIHKNAAKRYTLGIVYEPDEKDTQGDWTTEEEIEKACWDFMRMLQGRSELNKAAMAVLSAIVKALDDGNVTLDVTDVWDDLCKAGGPMNDMHASDFAEDETPDIVQCYCAPAAFEIDGEQVKKGSWLLGVVWPEEYFAKIERGERTGYSMEGRGRRVEDAETG